MGTDLASKFAASGFRVTAFGRPGGTSETFLNRVSRSAEELGVKLDSGAIELCADSSRIDWSSVDLVNENVSEDLGTKKLVFHQIVKLAKGDTLITSNSSTFGISEISKGLSNPKRFFGLHFFMPAHLVPLVEIILSEKSDRLWADHLKQELTGAGFTPVVVRKDIPGFLANRIQAAMMREVWHLLENDVASAEDLDKAVVNGFGCRLLAAGPVMQKEISGLDITYAANKNVFRHLSNATEPPGVLADKISSGNLGMKTGKGFWNWNESSSSKVRKKYIDQLKAAINLISLK